MMLMLLCAGIESYLALYKDGFCIPFPVLILTPVLCHYPTYQILSIIKSSYMNFQNILVCLIFEILEIS